MIISNCNQEDEKKNKETQHLRISRVTNRDPKTTREHVSVALPTCVQQIKATCQTCI